MKKIVSVLSLLLMVVCLVSCGSDYDYKIGIVQIVDHESLNTIRDSVIEKLEEEGYTKENTKIYTDSAAGDAVVLKQIISDYESKSVDVIVAIATPTAQAALSVSSSIPVIFSAVSDPIGAGLLDDLKSPNKNMTGTSDEIQVDKILDLALEIEDDIKTIGYIYNASEDNSVSNLKKVKEYAALNDLTVKEVTVTSASEIMQNATKLKDCDIVFAPNDNTIATQGAMKVLSDICTDNDIALYVGADSMVSAGGFATYGINYEDLGLETGVMVDLVLTGTSVSSIEVKVFKDNLNIYINKDVLQELGITLKEEILNNDRLIYIE